MRSFAPRMPSSLRWPQLASHAYRDRALLRVADRCRTQHDYRRSSQRRQLGYVCTTTSEDQEVEIELPALDAVGALLVQDSLRSGPVQRPREPRTSLTNTR